MSTANIIQSYVQVQPSQNKDLQTPSNSFDNEQFETSPAEQAEISATNNNQELNESPTMTEWIKEFRPVFHITEVRLGKVMLG